MFWILFLILVAGVFTIILGFKIYPKLAIISCGLVLFSLIILLKDAPTGIDPESAVFYPMKEIVSEIGEKRQYIITMEWDFISSDVWGQENVVYPKNTIVCIYHNKTKRDNGWLEYQKIYRFKVLMPNSTNVEEYQKAKEKLINFTIE